MKNAILTVIVVLLVFSCFPVAMGQTTAPKPVAAQESGITPNYALGDVMAVDAANNRLIIRTKVGDVSVLLDDKTKFLRVPPGATTTEKAEAITLLNISIGDRAMALGKVADDRKSVPARRVIIMSKAAIAQKQDHDREEWQRRGVVGTVTALNLPANEFTLAVRSREGIKPLSIAASEATRFRRYAPDSVKFSDAKPSTYAELKVGDQVRALGEKSADGTSFTPEEVVSGTFRTVAGTVVAIDSATREVKINDLQNNRALTAAVNKDSVLRRFPADMAAMFTTPGGRDIRSQQAGGRDQNQGEERRTRGATSGGSPDGAGPRRRGGFDIEQLIERLPEITIADLKPGDVILVSSTSGADPSRLTTIKLVAGVEPFLRMMQARKQSRGVGTNGPGFGGDLGAGLPDLGIGLP